MADDEMAVVEEELRAIEERDRAARRAKETEDFAARRRRGGLAAAERKRRGWSRFEVAKRADCHPNSVMVAERGASSVEMLSRIEKALGLRGNTNP